MSIRPPLPPFTRETAIEKVRLAENGWNTRDAEKVALAYTEDSWWRNRAEFAQGREAITALLKRKWTRELDYRLVKELWAFDGARIAVRFAYEYHDDSGQWYRAYGNENWEFDAQGLMHHRHACINEQIAPDAGMGNSCRRRDSIGRVVRVGRSGGRLLVDDRHDAACRLSSRSFRACSRSRGWYGSPRPNLRSSDGCARHTPRPH